MVEVVPMAVVREACHDNRDCSELRKALAASSLARGGLTRSHWCRRHPPCTQRTGISSRLQDEVS